MSQSSNRPPKRHIFMCTGPRCAPAESPSLYAYLKEKLRERARERGKEEVLRSQCQCLGICSGGPLAVVYPEGVWYGALDREKLDRILHEHMDQGRPVEAYRLERKADD